ncbi:uncharacterized protein LOC125657961 [Ostrea edulis]|uniref:uncharacterized protein LOC125657961 n=1 Tax=Ostrea edulis TaxID=37623 RepID=UPI0024AFAFD1|nr:uncharacterized protein LOC125657961 [Ostrea edulis]XP_048744897.2 uncharacterized protein LOC125657961 [Ostrea edulis]XP_048744898.2 uncharacterized protein LOC125657961 [Ostrea edulis]
MTEVFNFRFGGPGADGVAGCKEILLHSTQALLTGEVDELELFDYGPPNGHPEVRRHLAEFLTTQYKDNVERDNLFITAGATHGLHLVTTVLMSVDTPIFVEDPSYFLAIGMFREDYRNPVIPVPTDEYGIDVDALEKLLQETPAPAHAKTPFRRMLYTMTVHHNPRGVCLPPEKCRRLVSLARQYDMLMFCDDVYNLLTYTDNGVPPLRLLSYDNKEDPNYKGNTLSNCTFSKIFSPGVRLGWIETGPRVMKLLIDCFTTTSGYCYNHYMSCVIGKALELGLIESNLSRLRRLYGERIKTACRRLRENQLPVSFVEPKGGFFIWLQLPENMDGKDLCEKAKAANVLVQIGSKASPSGGWKNFIRLSISVCPVDKIEKGIDKLSEIIRSNAIQKV